MSLLVTGGCGFVGSHFVRLCCDAGLEVVSLDDLSGGATGPPPLPLAGPTQLHFVRGDIGDRELLQALFRRHRIDAVVHFAGRIQVGESMKEPALYFDTNLRRALTLVETAVAAGVDRLVFSSTAAVYGDPKTVPIPEAAPTVPTSPYGSSKLAFESVLRGYQVSRGLRWAALRYFNAAGAHPDGTLGERHIPETHLIPLCIDAALGRGPALTVFGSDYATVDGTCVRDYIHVSDLVRAHLLALSALAAQRPGEALGALNLGTGRGATVREVLSAVAEVSGRAVPHVIGERRAGDPPSLVADPSQAAARLGFAPERSQLPVLVEDALRARR